MLRRYFIKLSYSEDMPRNQIWYKTSNGEKFEYSILMNVIVLLYGRLQSNLLKKNNLIHNDWWCLTFTNNVTYTGLTDSEIGPMFWGLLDQDRTIETNVLNIIEIKLPSISFIGASSFQTCIGLHSITIPDNVMSIEDYAFSNCSSLTEITIPNSVISIGEYAFKGCSSLTTFVIPNSVTSIEEGAFKGCSALTSISMPNSVTSIGDSAFSDCSSLTSVTISDSVTSIGGWAFVNCVALTSITIPNSVTSIGEHAFYSCKALTSITYQGTIAQWSSITLGDNWKNNIPATVVHCTDGDVAIK